MLVIDHCYYQTPVYCITKYILEKYIQCTYVRTHEIVSLLEAKV